MVIALFRGAERVASAGPGDEVDLVTDTTPFYGESGGQVGDVGAGAGAGIRLEIAAARRPTADLVIHRAKVAEGTVREGAAVGLAVDEAARRRTQANHTATHLLQAALRRVLGAHVKQAGSYVGPDKLRFDFSHFEAVPAGALREVEDLVNEAIQAGRPVTWEYLPYEAAVAAGAMAFFGEKYADTVRMVTVEGLSRELCGGTHVRRTEEIGLFRIVSEGALAAGVRRIEALTGAEAFRHLREEAGRLHAIAGELKVAPADAGDRVRKLLAQVKALEKELQDAKRRVGKDLAGDIAGRAVESGGVRIVAAEVEPMDAAALRELADAVKGKLKSGLLLLGTRDGGRVHLVAGVTADLTAAYSASDLVQKAAAQVGGGGGGRRDMAQAGGTGADGLPQALASLAGWVSGG
ncbi:MAG TPA: DHHA1 domain-containing protein, partial [Vicinamibacteria bacterium]